LSKLTRWEARSTCVVIASRRAEHDAAFNISTGDGESIAGREAAKRR